MKRRNWRDRPLNAIRSLIKHGAAWRAFFLSRENSMTLTLRHERQRNSSQPPRATIAGRYSWRSSVATAKALYAKLNLNQTNVTAVLSLRLHTRRARTPSRLMQL